MSEFSPIIRDIKVNYGPFREGDVPHSHANINKAKYLLNYNPKFSLKKGLRESVRWYWENLDT